MTIFLDVTGSESGLMLSKDTLEVRSDYAVIQLAVFLAWSRPPRGMAVRRWAGYARVCP